MKYQDAILLDATNVSGTQTGTTTDRIQAYGYDAFVLVTFITVGPVVIAAAGWAPATDTITKVGHGLYTGMAYQVTTDGVLPTGIAGATTYYVIRLDADTFALASSFANALAGTKLNFTDAGAGNHTLTQQASAATWVLEASPDGTNWAPFDGMVAAALTGGTMAHKHFESGALRQRIKVVPTAGAFATAKLWINSKG